MSIEPTDSETEALIAANPNGCTLDQIAATLGVTRQRADQILHRAILKVRKEMAWRGIRASEDGV